MKAVHWWRLRSSSSDGSFFDMLGSAPGHVQAPPSHEAYNLNFDLARLAGREK
eukprot:COSAG01_NODE_72127_length_254_cov_0.496774_1_plen_52_part_01